MKYLWACKKIRRVKMGVIKECKFFSCSRRFKSSKRNNRYCYSHSKLGKDRRRTLRAQTDPVFGKQYSKEHKKRHRFKLATIPGYRQRLNIRSREGNTRVKIEVLSFYGPDKKLQCSWDGCEITDIDMLSLDHINNDRTKNSPSGTLIYKKLRMEGFPIGFQTLCLNHNIKKEILRKRALRCAV